MSSILSFPIIRIVVILGLSFFFKTLIPARIRDRIIPWSFALIIMHFNIMPFIGGGLHFLLMVMYWLNMAIVLNGFDINQMTRNRVLAAFLVFWGYYLLTSVRTDFPLYAFLYNVNALLELIFVGYFAGIWAMCRPDGFRRLVKPLVFVAVIPILIYLKSGFGGEIDDNGRAMLDEEILEAGLGNNVNGIALSLSPIVTLLLAYLLHDDRVKISKVMYIITGAVLFMSVYLLLRTGSRNGALIFLPCGWYFFKRMKNVRHKFVNMVIIGLAVLGAAGLMYRKAGALRSFTLSANSNVIGKQTINDISSGRVLIFQNLMAKSKGVDYVIGRGMNVVSTFEGKRIFGALSVYVSLLSYVGIFGLLLLLVLYIRFFWIAAHKGAIGQIAVLLFASWALTCVAEDAGINRAQLVGLLLGLSMAFCTDKRFGWERVRVLPLGRREDDFSIGRYAY